MQRAAGRAAPCPVACSPCGREERRAAGTSARQRLRSGDHGNKSCGMKANVLEVYLVRRKHALGLFLVRKWHSLVGTRRIFTSGMDFHRPTVPSACIISRRAGGEGSATWSAISCSIPSMPSLLIDVPRDARDRMAFERGFGVHSHLRSSLVICIMHNYHRTLISSCIFPPQSPSLDTALFQDIGRTLFCARG
jgi:hypothetical protein